MKSEEIAKIAGVSRSTVSRVINNYSNVPEETRLRIMDIIEQYGYEPNSSARVLAGKGLNTIGLFIISIADKESANRVYQNSYFAPFLEMVIDTANKNGFYVLTNTVYNTDDYLKIKQAFLQKRVDGGIVVGTTDDAPVLMELIGSGHPLVLIDYDGGMNSDKTALTMVNSKNFEGACDGMEYLIKLGHRDIAFLAGRDNTYSGRCRLAAYKEVLKKYGIRCREDYILKGDFLRKSAYIETKRLIENAHKPTALFCANDEMALAAMEAIREAGLEIPEDISVLGFDDIPAASVSKPGLTTVKIPIDEMAQLAAQKLLELVADKNRASNEYLVPTRLIIRDSCAIAKMT